MNMKTSLDGLTGSLLDSLSYIIPGSLGLVAIFSPLVVTGVLEWKAISFGEAFLALPIMYFLGVLFSSIRPLRFWKNKIGTDEDAFSTSLEDDSLKALFTEAIKSFSGNAIHPEPWTIEKQLILRFYLAQEGTIATEYMQRQLALRQLRYNASVPIALLGIECALAPLLSITGIISYSLSIPLLILGFCISVVSYTALHMAATANIKREALYIFTATIALYLRKYSKVHSLPNGQIGATSDENRHPCK